MKRREGFATVQTVLSNLVVQFQKALTSDTGTSPAGLVAVLECISPEDYACLRLRVAAMAPQLDVQQIAVLTCMLDQLDCVLAAGQAAGFKARYGR